MHDVYFLYKLHFLWQNSELVNLFYDKHHDAPFVVIIVVRKVRDEFAEVADKWSARATIAICRGGSCKRMCEKFEFHISLTEGMFYFTYLPLSYMLFFNMNFSERPIHWKSLCQATARTVAETSDELIDLCRRNMVTKDRMLRSINLILVYASSLCSLSRWIQIARLSMFVSRRR